MKNAKIYLIGAFALFIGLLIGWFARPSQLPQSDMQTSHQHKANEAQQKDEIWTCSMHPQIRQNEPGICPICEMELIPLDNSVAGDDPTILKMSKAAVQLAQIQTTTVGNNADINSSQKEGIRVDGTIELDERSIKSQTIHLSGRIETMDVTFEGQYVSSGQKIASIYSTDLLAASQELITAAAFDGRVDGLKDAAIQKLKNWKITPSQIDQILRTKNPMGTIDIYADHAGYVLSKKRTQGDYVTQGQSLYTIGSTSRLWLIFNVFESDLALVKKGSSVTFTTASVPGKEFKTRITYIDPLLNKSSRTAKLRAEITTSQNQLKPGMLIDGIIATKENHQSSTKQSFTVPSTAVLWTGDRSVVYLQLPDTEIPSFQFREVTVGNRSSKFTTVLEGLSAGDEIVTHGAFAVDAASQLNNNASMMNRNVSIKKDISHSSIPSYVASTPAMFKGQLDDAVIIYLDLKDALVLTDATATKKHANLLRNKIEEVDMSQVKGDAHIFWMQQLKSIIAHSEKIQNAEDIEEQRHQFDFLSQTVINTLKAFGTEDKIYYVQSCPMANNNNGADWLSKEDKIRNPYFGDKMMKCGSVKLTLN